MKLDNQYYELLRSRVEEVLHRQMKSNGDFILLSTHIFTQTRAMVSTTTLKRFWGKIEQSETNKGIRTSTLDLLSRLCGYVDFSAFCQDGSANEETSSSPFFGNIVDSAKLLVGTVLTLMWKPDRCVTVRYEGLEVFRVIESINSKILKDATFQCSRFVEGEQLQIFRLMNPGEKPVNFVCAKQEGGLHVDISTVVK